MRKVEIACLLADGRMTEAERVVPALPAFEAAFAAFARGTLLATDRGPAAVEDLRPGARVRVAGGRTAILRWRGATMIVPGAAGQDPAMTRLTRFSGDALGFGRPDGDLVLGPAARVVHRPWPGEGPGEATAATLVPAADLVDHEGVVSVRPATPVQVFHLGFDAHERLLAGGLEVESFHPGDARDLGLDDGLLALWLACFPHKADLAAFGELGLPRRPPGGLHFPDAA